MKNICICGHPSQTGNYEKAVRAFSANPIFDLSAPADLLILPGGGDIDPCLLGEPNLGSYNIDSALDLKQFQYLDLFVKHGLPVIGICKGLQIINVYFGGTICQDLPTKSAHAYDHGDKLHPAHWTIPYLCFEVGKAVTTLPTTINSAHHQGISCLGTALEIIQYASDGIVEALRHKTLPVLGLQWHPERFFINGEDLLQPFLHLFL